MSLPWIKVYANLPRHAKSKRLNALLGRGRCWTFVAELWLWASVERPDGDVSDLEPKALAEVSGWPGNADLFRESIIAAGFLTDQGHLHQWAEYQPEHFASVRAEPDATPEDRAAKKRRQTAERMRRLRERNAGDAAVTRSDADVTHPAPTVTQSDAAVRHENGRKRARAEKETGELEGEVKQGQKHGAESSVTHDEAKDLLGQPIETPLEAKVTEVLKAWVKVTAQKRPIITGKGSEAKRSIIRARLGENGGDADELIRALSGWLKDDYYVSGGYSQVDNIYRSRDRVEKFLARADLKPAPNAPQGLGGALAAHPIRYAEPPQLPRWSPETEIAACEAFSTDDKPRRFMVPRGEKLPDGYDVEKIPKRFRPIRFQDEVQS